MLKLKLIICALFVNFSSFSQEKISIRGMVIDKQLTNDSIYFREGNSCVKYYEKSSIGSFVNNNKFVISTKISYPQRFYCISKREKGNIPNRFGVFFIDPTTTTVTVDTIGGLNQTNGKTGLEFKNKFEPYILGSKSKKIIESYIWDNSLEFENKLLNYTLENPNSYVALWFFIERFENKGYTSSMEKLLNSFSKKMKSEKLWKIVNQEFSKIKIRENQEFPKIQLQNTELKQEILTIPKAKYTLIDFWFSRCRPCLEEMPQWITIYKKYRDKDFNVIGISSDKTENVVSFWQKRIIEKGIPWKNYLDENAVFCASDRITRFPTNFLLNEKGVVIQKNIDPEDLEKILSENLK